MGLHIVYSELPLIWTPEMRPPPCIQATSKMSQSMLPGANPPLKRVHPSNQDALTGPKGGRIRGSPLRRLGGRSPDFHIRTHVMKEKEAAVHGHYATKAKSQF